MDYGHGRASDVPRAFYMQAGGYGQPKDSASTLPLVDDHSCVESINLDSLIATLQTAYLADSQASMKTLLSTHGSLKLIPSLVQELIDRTDRFEGYTSEAMAPIRELAQTEYTFQEMRQALLNMSENNVMLRYGNTVKVEHICSFRAYQIGNEDNGVLAVRGNELVAIPKAEADVTDPNNHWIILRHDNESYYCLYNLGTGYYLSLGSRPELSEIPHKIMLNASNGKYAIREGASKYIGFNANNVPITVSGTKAVRFELLDNYYLTPKTELVNALLEQTTSAEIATGIDEIEPVLPYEEETEVASLADDIAAVYYYDLQGQRVGYALQPSQPVIAHIILRNGASIVRKIVVK